MTSQKRTLAILDISCSFTGYSCRELTEDITPIADHRQSSEPHFAAICTGSYPDSLEQPRLMQGLSDRVHSKNTPVPADNRVRFEQAIPLLMEKPEVLL